MGTPRAKEQTPPLRGSATLLDRVPGGETVPRSPAARERSHKGTPSTARHTRSLAIYILSFAAYIVLMYPVMAVAFRLEEVVFGLYPGDAGLGLANLIEELVAVHWPSLVIAIALGGVIPAIVTHHLRAQIATALTAADDAHSKQREFISVISHEFRTPLTAIQGFSELMAEDDLPSEQVREFSHDINVDARRLSRMVNEILDLDRLDSGRTTITSTVVDLAAYVHEALDAERVLGPDHVFVNNVGAIAVRADPDKLTQILTNLVSNAVKYTPSGSTITVSAEPVGQMTDIVVRDDGPGIPAEALGRLFERYYRVESKTNARISGTGLGLAIVRQIAERHGGKAWCESEFGHGAAFHFTLPSATDADRAA